MLMEANRSLVVDAAQLFWYLANTRATAGCAPWYRHRVLFCALPGLPVSRADLFAHVIFPSLPIHVPPTPLGYPPIYMPCALLLRYWHYGTHHTPLSVPPTPRYQPLPPFPACHRRSFAHAVPPTPFALPLHTSHTSTYITAAVLCCCTHIMCPPFTFVHPNVL
jgi:hypothetical protein